MPYRLVSMVGHSYDKMIRKYRVRVQKYMVPLVLASVELQEYLLRETVLPAEETSALCYILLVQLRSRGYHPCRIELKTDLESSDCHLPYLNVLQGTEIITSKRPA